MKMGQTFNLHVIVMSDGIDGYRMFVLFSSNLFDWNIEYE